MIVFNISGLKKVNQLTKLRKFIYAIKNIIASKRTNKRDSYFYFDARLIGKQRNRQNVSTGYLHLVWSKRNTI